MNSAKIVAVTQSLVEVTPGEFLSTEEFISYAARVSNPSNQMNTETSEKLLAYCLRNAHFSIFEMVNVVMEVETTRDIARQILRHRSFSFQEFSQRYADPTKSLGMVTDREARLQDAKNRQNSVEVDDKDLQFWWNQRQDAVAQLSQEMYNWAVSKGIAKEQARVVLPEGLTVSKMYMNGTLRSWIHYCALRRGNGTQKEHRLVAESAWQQLGTVFKFLTEVK
jgi:thymidylate synthase (FAD)